jgi:hypothetical protein
MEIKMNGTYSVGGRTKNSAFGRETWLLGRTRMK